MRKIKHIIGILKFYKYNVYGALKFIRLNYFSKNIRRFGDAYFYPSLDSELYLSPTAIIELHGSFFLGFSREKKHDEQTLLFMDDYSRICVNQKLEIVGVSNIQIFKEGCLSVDEFYIESGAKVKCEYQLRLIGRVFAGKNVIMEDSLTERKPVIVEENVNIGSGVVITPGAYIESTTSIPVNAIVYGKTISPID